MRREPVESFGSGEDHPRTQGPGRRLSTPAFCVVGPPASSSARLTLRALKLDDLGHVVRMHRDPRLSEFLIDDVSLGDPVQALILLRRLPAFCLQHPGLGIWAAERSLGSSVEEGTLGTRERTCSPHAFAGWFSLMPMAGQPGEVELGCRLTPAFWSGSLSLEGAATVLDHAFFGPHRGRRRVWAICHSRHRSAQACLHMLGFSPEGDLVEPGRLCSRFALEAGHWLAQRHRPLAQRRREALNCLRRRGSGTNSMSMASTVEQLRAKLAVRLNESHGGGLTWPGRGASSVA